MFKKFALALVLTMPFAGMTAVANSKPNSDSSSTTDISGEIPMPSCGTAGCIPGTGK